MLPPWPEMRDQRRTPSRAVDAAARRKRCQTYPELKNDQTCSSAPGAAGSSLFALRSAAASEPRLPLRSRGRRPFASAGASPRRVHARLNRFVGRVLAHSFAPQSPAPQLQKISLRTTLAAAFALAPKPLRESSLLHGTRPSYWYDLFFCRRRW